MDQRRQRCCCPRPTFLFSIFSPAGHITIRQHKNELCWRTRLLAVFTGPHISAKKKHLWSSGDVPCRRLNVIRHGGSGQCSNSTGVEFSMRLVLKFQFDRPKLSKTRLMSQSNHLIDVMWFELSLIKYCALVWYGVGSCLNQNYRCYFFVVCLVLGLLFFLI